MWRGSFEISALIQAGSKTRSQNPDARPKPRVNLFVQMWCDNSVPDLLTIAIKSKQKIVTEISSRRGWPCVADAGDPRRQVVVSGLPTYDRT
jgi:hypothetical protein